MKKQPPKPQVTENPIADVFENRHPSNAEKKWAEQTLAPTLEKTPERPIGADGTLGRLLESGSKGLLRPFLFCVGGMTVLENVGDRILGDLRLRRLLFHSDPSALVR